MFWTGMIRCMRVIRGTLLVLSLVGATHASDTAGILFFESHIRPVLIEHCYQCHSTESKKLKAGFYLDSREGLLRGGDTGPALVPGNPGLSRVMEAIEYQNHDFQMPPKYKLDEVHIGNIRQWIEMGAPDPREEKEREQVKAAIDLEAGRQFWAFRKIQATNPPAIQNKQWPVDDIDHFILAKLEAKGLRPNDPADPETLIRRVYFDLTGLPPSPEQIDEYLAAPSQQTLAKIVDRLLASESYGERWGRHWLDVARFAESSGGGRSLMYEHAWRFRDYVIDALNRDKPFNEFIVEQLAGDLLPAASAEEYNEHLTASGFLMLGPTNYELQDKELLRMEVIDEQIDTMGRAFLGMTLGCARCHDHKFDPIPTRDYYALAGIFGSTQSLVPGNVSGFVTQPLRLPGRSKEEMLAMEAANAKKTKLAASLTKIETQLKEAGALQAKGLDPRRFPGIVLDDYDAKLIGRWKSSTFQSGFLGDRYIHDEGKNKGEKRAIFTPFIERGGLYEVRVSYTPGANRATSVPIVIHHQDGRDEVRIDQTKKPPIGGSFVSVGTYRFEADTEVSVTIETAGTKAVVIVDAVQFLRADGPVDVPDTETPDQIKPRSTDAPARDDKENARIAQLRKRQRKLEGELGELKRRWPDQKVDVAMSVKDAEKKGDGHLLIRGVIRNPGPLIPRGFLRVMMDPGESPEIPENQSGRLQLARWIAKDQNPLTSRVIVNRVWHYLFGSGIVRTTDNFGAMGERPSHPKLLDTLAAEFMADGWSIKGLIRRLMLSRTYQMSSEPHPEKIAVDIENRLMWRAQRKRLEAEAIRDAMLQISGQLDQTRGGLTIRKISQYDQYYQFDSRRRSVYVPCFRNSVLDIFAVFDMANPNLVIGRRSTSVLPTQALFMMNSPFVIDLARKTAILHGQSLSGDNDVPVDQLYRRILGRPPKTEELCLANRYLDGFGQDQREIAAASLCHSLFASIDFRTLY